MNGTKKYLLCLSIITAAAATALHFLININLLLCYLLAINFITFLLFAHDKRLAIKNRTRTPEFILLLIAAIGATPAAVLAMITFKHKTKKPPFKTTLAIIILTQLTIAAIIIKTKYL